MEFRYRYVGFGTQFMETQTGMRPVDSETAPSHLFENELVMDVGNVCWTGDERGESRWIIDHHFHNEFSKAAPCAAVAVLQNAVSIKQRLSEKGAGWPIFWLVTHEAPDFDAFCSMYLARCILDGRLDSESIRIASDSILNWFNPLPNAISLDVRGAFQLASYAAHVDQCRRLRCLRTKALHSVLHAAMARGRSFKDDGGHSFFLHVSELMEGGKLNPIIDSVFEGDNEFFPEMALLDREHDLYVKDIKRARKCVVNLKHHANFDGWFSELAQAPFLNPSGEINPVHLVASHEFRQADGLFLRDPECLLFKEWAREDTDNSMTGTGFLFTGIAYTHESARSQYFFALDPEKANGCHLYNVWARLEHAELQKKGKHNSMEGSRKDFAGRELVGDPWYDGNAYRATIIREPKAGSVLGAGLTGDLSDDAVAVIVSSELELSFYASADIIISDYSTLLLNPNGVAVEIASHPLRIETAIAQAPPADAFRFAAVPLAKISLQTPSLHQQIGRQLWMVLEDENVTSLPHDFREHYMVSGNHTVMAWSRKGVAIAYGTDQGKSLAERLKKQIQNMATISAGLTRLVAERKKERIGDQKLLRDAEKILDLIAELKHEASLPGLEIVRHMLDATRFDDVLATLNSINQQSYANEEKRNTIAIQIILAVSAILNTTFKWDGLPVARWVGIAITLLFAGFYVLHLTSPRLFRKLILCRIRDT